MALIKTQPLTEGVNPTPISFGIPVARSVIVDNYSNSFLYHVETGLYIPPRSSRQIGLPVQSSYSFLWQAPRNISNPTPTNGYASAAYSDEAAITSLATPIVGAPTANPVVIGFDGLCAQLSHTLLIQFNNGPPQPYTQVLGWQLSLISQAAMSGSGSAVVYFQPDSQPGPNAVEMGRFAFTNPGGVIESHDLPWTFPPIPFPLVQRNVPTDIYVDTGALGGSVWVAGDILVT